jgi:hypothetical protein
MWLRLHETVRANRDGRAHPTSAREPENLLLTLVPAQNGLD